MRNVSVDRVLSQIQKESDYRFFYNYGHLKHLDKVNIQVKDMPVTEILDRLLDNSLSYRLLPDELVVIAPKGVQSDDYKLDGVVTDDQGRPLSGVSIQVKGSATGATTDESGKFWIVVPRSAVLVFSYIGFQTQEIPVDGRASLRVQLQVAVSGLNEVVVTALGITREKRAIGYAVQSIKGEEISTSASPNLVQALSGKAAGLFITGGTTGLGGSSNIIVRGNTNLSGNNLPLFVIDGIPFFNDEVDKQSFWDSFVLFTALEKIEQTETLFHDCPMFLVTKIRSRRIVNKM
ncbi:carboxypeptidase-like regulatory domain-containing protein [Parapedobacter sp. 2B3]|uniref:STN domain-containing protein n=1 Tax=Parapedobacter sp. 2B3 TaxID=3342381 RepID=UPI0035B5B2E9